jgi:hypothetical protein
VPWPADRGHFLIAVNCEKAAKILDWEFGCNAMLPRIDSRLSSRCAPDPCKAFIGTRSVASHSAVIIRFSFCFPEAPQFSPEVAKAAKLPEGRLATRRRFGAIQSIGAINVLLSAFIQRSRKGGPTGRARGVEIHFSIQGGIQLMWRVLCVFCFAAAVAFSTVADTHSAGMKENLSNCLDGLSGCNLSELTPEQASEIGSIRHDNNLYACLTGLGMCDRSGLSPQEAQEVSEGARRRNFLFCQTGMDICDTALLTPEQLAVVNEIQKQQNLANCETGTGVCDTTQLTRAQAQEVEKLKDEQNLLRCETGDALCEDSLLSAAEKSKAAREERGLNLLGCTTGQGYCDSSLLSAAEAKEVDEATNRRNDIACEAGDVTCDTSLLPTKADRQKVAWKTGPPSAHERSPR